MCLHAARLQEKKKNFVEYSHIFVLSSHMKRGSMVRQVISNLSKTIIVEFLRIHLILLKGQKLLKSCDEGSRQ